MRARAVNAHAAVKFGDVAHGFARHALPYLCGVAVVSLHHFYSVFCKAAVSEKRPAQAAHAHEYGVFRRIAAEVFFERGNKFSADIPHLGRPELLV